MFGKIKIILTVFFGILLVSCTKLYQEDRSIDHNLNVVNNVVNQNTNDQLIVDLPIKLDSLSDHIVFQVRNIDTEYENKMSYNSRKEFGDNYLRNLIFQNIQTEETQVLTTNKIKIISYEELYNAKNNSEKVILYKVIDTFSEDEDTVTNTSLYLSTNDGKNFKKISAKNHHLNSWEYLPELKKVYFKTIEDSDGNNLLNNLDKHHLYAVSIKDFIAKELFTEELKSMAIN